MTSRQIELIEESWDYVILNTSEAGKLFYQRLFETSPHLRSLFKEDMADQERKLIALITFAVGKLHDIDGLNADVKALGSRHKGYGVKDEHYNDVANALLWTLEKGLGGQWNEELQQAWVVLYTMLAAKMQEAPAPLS